MIQIDWKADRKYFEDVFRRDFIEEYFVKHQYLCYLEYPSGMKSIQLSYTYRHDHKPFIGGIVWFDETSINDMLIRLSKYVAHEHYDINWNPLFHRVEDE